MVTRPRVLSLLLICVFVCQNHVTTGIHGQHIRRISGYETADKVHRIFKMADKAGVRSRRQASESDWQEGATKLANTVFAARGSSITLHCRPSDVAEFVDVTYAWKDSVGRSLVDSRFVTMDTGSLRIDDVQPEDSGRYTCHVQHSANDPTGSKTDEFQHHLLEYLMPEYVEFSKFVYDTTGCDGELTRGKEQDFYNALCPPAETTDCPYYVTTTCHDRSEEINAGDFRTSHKMWVEITTNTDVNFVPPACGAICMKEAILDNIEKNYLLVEALETEEMLQTSPDVQFSAEKFEKTSLHSCGGGYRSYGSIVCLPCHPGTFSHNGATSCSSCAKNFYQDKYAMSECFRCPKDGVTDGQDADSEVLCKERGVTELTVKIDEGGSGAAIGGAVGAVVLIGIGGLVWFLKKKKAFEDRQKIVEAHSKKAMQPRFLTKHDKQVKGMSKQERSEIKISNMLMDSD